LIKSVPDPDDDHDLVTLWRALFHWPVEYIEKPSVIKAQFFEDLAADWKKFSHFEKIISNLSHQNIIFETFL
jgi:hypothetical protein